MLMMSLDFVNNSNLLEWGDPLSYQAIKNGINRSSSVLKATEKITPRKQFSPLSIVLFRNSGINRGFHWFQIDDIVRFCQKQ